MNESKRTGTAFKWIYLVIFSGGLLIDLPYGLPWFICFWALIQLLFDRQDAQRNSAEKAGWPLIVATTLLPPVIFGLHEALALEIDHIFRLPLSGDRYRQLFPGVLYGVLYAVPLVWLLRRRGSRTGGFVISNRHVALMVLTTLPFLVSGLRSADYYRIRFESVPDIDLLLMTVKPFYFNGLWEELYYRGLIFSLLLTRMPVAAAAAVSALIFTFSHYDLLKTAGSADLSLLGQQLAGIWGLGLVTAYAFWRTASIWPGVVFHSLTSGAAYLTGYLAR